MQKTFLKSYWQLLYLFYSTGQLYFFNSKLIQLSSGGVYLLSTVLKYSFEVLVLEYLHFLLLLYFYSTTFL